MIVIGILMSAAALGAICWLLFNLAVFALPFFAGMTVGMAALHAGAGLLGAFAVGVLAGAATLFAGQLVLVLIPSPLVRGGTALLFAVPAAIAGYYVMHGIAALTMSAGWQQAFAMIGAAIVGGTALARLGQRIIPPVRHKTVASRTLAAE